MRLIDADALLDKFGIPKEGCDGCKFKNGFYCDGDGEDFVDICIAIEDAPTVDAVERKRGRWKICPDPDSEGEYGVCSKCGHGADFGSFVQVYDFCPWCGADMRGGEE